MTWGHRHHTRGVPMISDRKLNANRINAQKSTGPRTEKGKTNSSQNATSHALFCKDLVLPHEDKTLFHVIRHSFLHSLNPQNLLELSLVDQIVSATWRLR